MALVVFVLLSAVLFVFLSLVALGQSGVVPLHYNVHFGIDFIGPWFYLFILPLTGVSTALMNALVIFVVYDRAQLVAYFLSVTTLLIQVILTASVAFILLFNV
jgi:hypothetical protein